MRDAQVTYTPISWSRIAAKGAWLLSTFFTYLFIAQLVPDIYPLTAVVVATLLQLLFTICERPLWKRLLRREGGFWSYTAALVTLIDGVVFNGGGMYPYVPRIAATNAGAMISSAFAFLPPIITSFSHFLIAGVLGTLSAGLYEYLEELER